jgi:hypothetical protein
MATKAEQLQYIWHQFEAETDHLPSGTREVGEWAVSRGLIGLPKIDPYDVLAGQIANALREETTEDASGRRYRVNHAARITKNGVQHTFWAMMNFAPHAHMEISFAQRREQVIGDCVKLKTDVDAYKALNAGQHEPIQLVLDFTEDVEERQAAA